MPGAGGFRAAALALARVYAAKIFMRTAPLGWRRRT